ncbi:UDP-glucuronosyltransferase 1-3-like [Trichogramma pretiosum]|uniref:UDP-glucuronosyltransferase 1-3-like n=1 Tax=Trichogramma pretiosum TaxID=7493 RepID=UPI000C719D00|nr:UDP-glucuronosyltransferase 1-3-like [Trichogramma pretiosum]
MTRAWIIAVLLLAATLSTSHGLRILGIFPLQGKSHFVMCEALMRGLAAKGHQVDVYSHFPLKKPIPNYKDYSLAGTLPALANNMTYDYMNSFGGVISIPVLMNLIGNPVCELLNLPIFQNLIKNPPNDPPYDLVIIEMFLSNCYLELGHHLNVPIVSMVTTSLFEWMYRPLGNPSRLAVEPTTFSGGYHPMSFKERLSNVVLSHYFENSFNREARNAQNAMVEKAFGPGMPDVIDLQKEISLTLVNYHHALNGVRAFTPSVVPVGGIHVFENEDVLPANVKTFMDESKDGFIYVSFGSMVQIETFPEHDIKELYASFKNIAPIRVVMKIAKPELLPPGLPSNVITHSWLPQVKVLKHKNIKAFVTHGGLMGTQESIYYGVPLIGFPLFGDQHFNIESYAKKNLAIKLDRHNIKEETLTAAIKEIVNNPAYKNSADKVGKAFRDAPLSPLNTAIYWVEYIVKHGKYSLRPPIVDLPWWQASLLDVYAFLAAIFILLLVIFYKLVAILIKLIFNLQKSKPRKMKKK